MLDEPQRRLRIMLVLRCSESGSVAQGSVDVSRPSSVICGASRRLDWDGHEHVKLSTPDARRSFMLPVGGVHGCFGDSNLASTSRIDATHVFVFC